MPSLFRKCTFTFLIAALLVASAEILVEAAQETKAMGESVVIGSKQIVVCSEFEAFNASQVARFLHAIPEKNDQMVFSDGPLVHLDTDLQKTLVVVIGQDPRDKTLQCIDETLPIYDEVALTIASVRSGLGQRPNLYTSNLPEDALGPTEQIVSMKPYPDANLIVTVVGILRPTNERLNRALIRVFDQPIDTCRSNKGCLQVTR